MFMLPEEYFKDQYFYELGRRDRMTSELSLPFAILIASIGGIVALIDRIQLPLRCSDLFVLFFLTTAFLLICVVAGFLWFSWSEPKYCYPATTDEIKQYGDELAAHFKETDTDNEENHSRKMLKSFLLSEYIRCAAANAKTNDNRAGLVSWSKRLILPIIAFIAMGFFTSFADRVL